MDNFLKILSKPDNIPIVIALVLVFFYTIWGYKQALANDRALRETGKLPPPDKLSVWPYLVRTEFIGAIVVMLILTVWSIVLNAPLEEPANPTKTPNPSKAPWYFLGLQEMLVYFDPWIAGVVLPSLIIVGLMAIPYIDLNPRGNGYYSWSQRKFAHVTFMFGFLVLWLVLIFWGTFMRGPGWYFFWPWQYWDPHKIVALTNVDLHEWFGIRHQPAMAIFGLSLVGVYYSLIGVFWKWKAKGSYALQQLGAVRYGIVAFLFLTMMGLPIKMFLRLAFNIKYICVTPWFNI